MVPRGPHPLLLVALLRSGVPGQECGVFYRCYRFLADLHRSGRQEWRRPAVQACLRSVVRAATHRLGAARTWAGPRTPDGPCFTVYNYPYLHYVACGGSPPPPSYPAGVLVGGQPLPSFAPADARGAWLLAPGLYHLFFDGDAGCGWASLRRLASGFLDALSDPRPLPPALGEDEDTGEDSGEHEDAGGASDDEVASFAAWMDDDDDPEYKDFTDEEAEDFEDDIDDFADAFNDWSL